MFQLNSSCLTAPFKVKPFPLSFSLFLFSFSFFLTPLVQVFGCIITLFPSLVQSPPDSRSNNNHFIPNAHHLVEGGAREKRKKERKRKRESQFSVVYNTYIRKSGLKVKNTSTKSYSTCERERESCCCWLSIIVRKRELVKGRKKKRKEREKSLELKSWTNKPSTTPPTTSSRLVPFSSKSLSFHFFVNLHLLSSISILSSSRSSFPSASFLRILINWWYHTTRSCPSLCLTVCLASFHSLSVSS